MNKVLTVYIFFIIVLSIKSWPWMRNMNHKIIIIRRYLPSFHLYLEIFFTNNFFFFLTHVFAWIQIYQIISSFFIFLSSTFRLPASNCHSTEWILSQLIILYRNPVELCHFFFINRWNVHSISKYFSMALSMVLGCWILKTKATNKIFEKNIYI